MAATTPTLELIGYLKADATLAALVPGSICEEPAWQTASLPVVVIGLADGIDDYASDGMESAATTLLYSVQVFGLATSDSQIRQAADRLHAIWRRGAMTLAGWRVLRARRRGPIERADPETPTNPLRMIRRGGLYELIVEAT